MRDAKHGRTARAVYAGCETNAVRRRPAITSFAPPTSIADHKLARGRMGASASVIGKSGAISETSVLPLWEA
jgi:hypothetical protein